MRGSDIVELDPLRIDLNDSEKILQARILTYSRKQISVDLKSDPSSDSTISIVFDFMDAGDGAILEVFHGGTTRPKLAGTIRGAKIKSFGEVSLSAKSIDLIRTKSAIRRYAKRRGRFSLIVLSFFLLPTSMIVALALRNSNTEQLVDPRKYNLNTLAGQAEFAKKVKDLGIKEPWDVTSYAMLAFVVILTLSFVLFTIWSTAKRIVPPSVVKEETEKSATTINSA
ncbi:hypothetical protein ACWEU6_11680 [Streptosporangium sandarakinum]|uniref:hypothetical protein n=1 Tax=Streptosporangium sandarakinum TaxID=1260955 RepID=UPI0036A91CBC